MPPAAGGQECSPDLCVVDVLHFVISDEIESSSVELSPNVTGELNEKGELI